MGTGRGLVACAGAPAVNRALFLMGVAAISLAGCDLFEAPSQGSSEPGPGEMPTTSATAGAFAHSQSEDLSGYYRPAGMAGADDFELTQVFIGQTQDFEAWEKGQRSATFGPVMLEFAVVGGESLRVLPDRYSVSDNRVSMSGTAPGVGEVSFDARLDRGALSTARRNLGGNEAPAMTGSVRIGGQTYSGVKFSWYGGD